MRIIPAKKEHLDSLVSLNIEVQNLHIGFEPEIFKQPNQDEIKEFFRDILRDKNREILICHDEGRPVGYISLQIGGHEEHPFCYAQKWIYIDQIGVKKEFRGKGIGKKLIDAARAFAKQHQINRMILDVWSVNENAKAFFRKQGFFAFLERMKLEV